MTNGLYSPIEQILMASDGLKAVISQPFVGDYQTYDPGSPDDYTPGEPQKAEVFGIWSLGSEQGLQQGETAAFMVPASQLPSGEPRTEQATVTLVSPETGKETTYRIARIGRRVFGGETDGYVLYLSA